MWESILDLLRYKIKKDNISGRLILKNSSGHYKRSGKHMTLIWMQSYSNNTRIVTSSAQGRLQHSWISWKYIFQNWYLLADSEFSQLFGLCILSELLLIVEATKNVIIDLLKLEMLVKWHVLQNGLTVHIYPRLLSLIEFRFLKRRGYGILSKYLIIHICTVYMLML